MGTFLFVIGITMSIVLICTGVAFLINELMNGDSIIIKILATVFIIAIAIILVLTGLKLGVRGINV